MDISKLKFDIDVDYDCDEGIGCNKYLDNGTYDQAVNLFSRLNMPTYITGYYHTMTINIIVYDEQGNQLDLSKILDGDYEWLDDEYYTINKNYATELPSECLKFLEDLKNGDKGKKAREVKELKVRIKKLKKELKEAEEELAELEEKE